MKSDTNFKNADELSTYFKRLHEKRKNNKQKNKRKSLTRAERDIVLAKTNGLCHICGGKIESKTWQADHVSPHIYGGVHSVDNYLPAHSKCNRSRWLYGPEEFQLILDLGIWFKTRVEKKNKLALKLVEGFVRQ